MNVFDPSIRRISGKLGEPATVLEPELEPQVVTDDEIAEYVMESGWQEEAWSYMHRTERVMGDEDPDVTTVEPLTGQTTTTENDSCAGERPDK